ncbi:MAG: hypothetical protein AB7U23_10420, partial [Dehalococcoidia bacterium]
VLSEGGVDVFLLNMNEFDDVPPYYIEVAGRRFSYSSSTFPTKGHGAHLPRFIAEQEAAGNLVVLGERNERYIAYVHDPNAPTEDEEGE